MTPREHARLARELIAAAGGLEEASRACRVSRPVLSTYQNPARDDCFMPADVMAALQAYVGRSIYSDAVSALTKATPVTGCLKELAFDLAQESMDVVTAVREALADDRLSANDLDAISRAERDAEAALERVRAVRRAAENASDDRRAA